MSSLVQRANKHARETHARLMNPPNAVADTPIDLRPIWRKPEVVETQDTPEPEPIPVEINAVWVPPYKIAEPIPEYLLSYHFSDHISQPFGYSAFIKNIQKAVCNAKGISRDEMLSPRRHPRLVLPRMMAVYLAKKLTKKSLPEIGRRFRRDHTTILHAFRKIEAMRRTDAALDSELTELEALLVAPPSKPVVAVSNKPEETPCSSAQTAAA